ncbi:auxin-induced in root cultures protein 12-like [Bidens hawaiensis]|uniref:auxin-induced in root cultures protein 12-like n=1 Tax=Bidens hawaiensis TaxID=980011 RepID=UPI004049F6A6
MAGAQSFIAFKGSKGSMTVKTYNISSYSSIVEGKIAFEVPEASAEFSGGVMRIFATMKLPEAMTEVNHIWPEFMGCLLLFLDGWRGGSRRAVFMVDVWAPADITPPADVLIKNKHNLN